MDLVSEVGEVVKDATKSSEYGMKKEELEVKEDEIGDVLFSLCAVANDLDINLEEAFESTLKKYETRIEEEGDPGST
jgi:NTP pyrophosphatase (non-canonical NTP hydrolase)